MKCPCHLGLSPTVGQRPEVKLLAALDPSLCSGQALTPAPFPAGKGQFAPPQRGEGLGERSGLRERATPWAPKPDLGMTS